MIDLLFIFKTSISFFTLDSKLIESISGMLKNIFINRKVRIFLETNNWCTTFESLKCLANYTNLQ